jgi:hypothetical protein
MIAREHLENVAPSPFIKPHCRKGFIASAGYFSRSFFSLTIVRVFARFVHG